MKAKYLLLTALLSVSAWASAQSLTAVWERPVPAASDFTTWAPETTYYLYNVGANAFYIAYQGGTPDDGVYWQTRSSVNDTIGAEVKFTRTNPNPAVEFDWTKGGDNTYLFTSWVPKHQGWYCTFSSGAFNSVWTDNNNDYDRAWNVIQNSDGTLSFEINDAMAITTGGYEYVGKYVGVWAADADHVLYLHDTAEIPATDAFYDTWRVMTPEAYEAYILTAKAQIYRVIAAEELKAKLETAMAEHPTLDFSAPIGVYNNLSSTEAQLKAALAQVDEIIIADLSGGATPTNPKDLTEMIKNPGFDGIKFDGWLGDTFGAGGDVDEVAEHFNKNFDTYQLISGLQPGVYVVKVNGFYRAGETPALDQAAVRRGEASNTNLYISGETFGEFDMPIKHLTGAYLTQPLGLPDGNMQTEVSMSTADGTIWFPNTMVGANAYFHLPDNPDLYKSTIAGAIGEGDVLRFGVKKTQGVSLDWSIFDDFQLFYYGNSMEAWQVIVDAALETQAIDLTGDDVFYGKPEYDAYQDLLNALRNATTPEAVKENLDDLPAARTLITASIDAYADYVALISELREWLETATVDQGTTEFEKLEAYLDNNGDNDTYTAMFGFPNGISSHIIDFENDVHEGLLSTEEIRAEIQYANELKNEAISAGMEDGTDLTSLIKNPTFNNGGAGGWLTDPQYNGGNITNWHGGGVNGVWTAECFNHNFDVYQIIEGLDNGLYEVSVQAFYRTTDNANAEIAYLYDYPEAKVLSEVYLNEFYAPVKSVMEIKFTENLANNCYSTQDGYYTLDGMASAAAAFSLTDETKNFTQKVYGLVTDHKLRLGIRNTTGTLNARWTLFDNFQLIYRAKNTEALASVIDNYADRAEQLSSNIYGRTEKNALKQALNTATAATTGDAMYSALIALVNAYNTAAESVNLYEQLNQGLDDLNEALINAEPSSSAFNGASDYYDVVDEAYSNGDYDNAGVQEALKQINEWIARLRLPEIDPNVGDNNPQNFTQAIVNPSFDIVNDFTGWLGTPFGTGGDAGANAEHFQSNFDSYQDIFGLPAGTYEVRVKGLYRYGNSQGDYAAYHQYAEADHDPTRQSFLYASTESVGRVSTPIVHITQYGLPSPDFTNENGGTADDPCYVANSRTSADLYFHDHPNKDAYAHSIFITINEGDVLRIGVMMNMEGAIPQWTWSIFDDFELWYYGTASSHPDSGDAVHIDDLTNIPATSVTGIYSLSGARLQQMQRGVNIVRMADGTVRKVFVK